MDTTNLFSIVDGETRNAKTKKKKRKWREIEAIHDQYRLRKELKEMDLFDELEELAV